MSNLADVSKLLLCLRQMISCDTTDDVADAYVAPEGHHLDLIAQQYPHFTDCQVLCIACLHASAEREQSIIHDANRSTQDRAFALRMQSTISHLIEVQILSFAAEKSLETVLAKMEKHNTKGTAASLEQIRCEAAAATQLALQAKSEMLSLLVDAVQIGDDKFHSIQSQSSADPQHVTRAQEYLYKISTVASKILQGLHVFKAHARAANQAKF